MSADCDGTVFDGRQLPPPIPLTPQARATHADIVLALRHLKNAGYRSPLEPQFTSAYREILVSIERFQQQVLAGEIRVLSCRKGCMACCCHWVEDVTSFEAQILAEHIRRVMPERIGHILETCQADIEAIEALDRHVDDTLRTYGIARAENASIDHTDLLLASFYRFRRPCPLLDSRGLCSVYDLRPLTCRIYVSFSPPGRCDPDYDNEEDIPTCLLDLEESANSLLDELHAMYDCCDNDTSLRSLLVKLLC